MQIDSAVSASQLMRLLLKQSNREPQMPLDIARNSPAIGPLIPVR